MIENDKSDILFCWKDDNNIWVQVNIPCEEFKKIKNMVGNYVYRVYQSHGYKNPLYSSDINDTLLEIGGFYYHTEYINKFTNNRKTYENMMKINDIRDKESFIRFLRYGELFNQYHYSGKMFFHNYNTVEECSTKGSRAEIYARGNFEMFINDKYKEIKHINEETKKITNPNINMTDLIKVNYPKNAKEDFNGIDGSFIFNNQTFTVQVKPFISKKENGDNLEICSNGSMTFNTHYLVLYKEINNNKKYTYDIIILQNGINKDKIKIDGNNYITNKINKKN